MKIAGDDGKLHFDVTHGVYAPFVNDSPYAIRISEVTWPTVTHYLLGERFPAAVRAGLRLTRSVGDALKSVKAGGFAERPKWDVFKDDYQYRALAAKFTQHLDLEQLLFDTGNRELVYADPEDRYYGVDSMGDGHNMLGRLLMRVRRNLGRLRLDYLWGEGTANSIEEAETAVRNNPNDVYSLSYLAAAYHKFGWIEQAVTAARQALHASKDCEEWNCLILAKSLLALGLDEEAVEALKRLTALDPEDWSYFELLATALANVGKVYPAKFFALRARQLQQKNQKPDDSAPWNEQ